MNSLIRDAFIIVFARGFIRLSQLLTFLLLARFLTPTEFGWFGLITTAIVLAATVGSLGLRQSVAYEIGRRYLTPGEGTATILMVWPILAGISSAVVSAFYIRDSSEMGMGSAIGAIGVGVFSTMLLMMLQGVYLGRGDIRAFSSSETTPRVILAVLTVVIVATSQVSISTAMWSYSTAFAAAACLAFVLARKDKTPLTARPERLGKLFGYGAAFSINLFLITLCSRISMFMLEHEFGAAHAGNFFAAIRVNDIVLEAATAFGLVVFSKAVKDSDTSRVATRSARVACWAFWTFTIGAASVAFVAPSVLEIAIGNQYAEAGEALIILAFGLGAASANKIIYPSIAGQGRPLFGTPVIIFSLVVNIFSAFALVPRHGVRGGAVALVIGQYVMLVGYIITCRLKFGTPVKLFFVPERADLIRLRDFMRANAIRFMKR